MLSRYSLWLGLMLTLLPVGNAVLVFATHPVQSSPATPIQAPVEWRFSEPQPDWKPTLALADTEVARLDRTADALRVTLSEGSRIASRQLGGGVYVDLPDWRREEWAEVVVRARTTGVTSMRIGLNPPEDAIPAGAAPIRAVMGRNFQARGALTPIVRDGLVHRYRIHVDWGSDRTGSWRRIGLLFEAPEPGSIDILSVHVVPAGTGQARDRVVETTLAPQQLTVDFSLFKRALEEVHPALYMYKTKRELDAEFAKAEAKLTRPLTVLQFRSVLEPVLVALGGKTKFTDYQGDEIGAVLRSARQFPLALTFSDTRGFVLLNQGLDDRVKPGMEVLAINGWSLAATLQRILPHLSGGTRSWAFYQLGMWAGDFRSRDFFQVGARGSGFGEAYRLYVGDPPIFKTALRDSKTGNTIVIDLAGVTFDEARANVDTNPINRDVLAGLRTLRIGISSGGLPPLRYLDGEETALLANAFGADFPDVLKNTFAELKTKGTRNLIIDMRGNTGGSDRYPPLLFSYLTSKEFRYVESNHVNTFEPSFKQYTTFDRDLKTDSYFGPASGIWKPDPRGGWLMTEKYPTIGVQKPSENHFDGPVYVLINGGSYSAGATFPAIAELFKRAIFIGEETGNAVQGGTGGSDIGPTLPESHLHLGIQIEAYSLVVGRRNPRRGTLPTHVVRQTIDDLARGRDTVLEFTRELIRSKAKR